MMIYNVENAKIEGEKQRESRKNTPLYVLGSCCLAGVVILIGIRYIVGG